MKTTTRRVTVVDNRALAKRVGLRIRNARIAAGMTQAELAKDRYTSAYISALERGLAKPPMGPSPSSRSALASPCGNLSTPIHPPLLGWTPT